MLRLCFLPPAPKKSPDHKSESMRAYPVDSTVIIASGYSNVSIKIYQDA